MRNSFKKRLKEDSKKFTIRESLATSYANDKRI